MSKDAKKGVNTVINTFVDRVVDRVDSIEPTVEKGKETVKKLSETTVEGIGVVINASADYFAGVVNGEGIKIKKEDIKNTIETLTDTAGEYIETLTQDVVDNIEQLEEIIEKDIDAAKKVKQELKDNINS